MRTLSRGTYHLLCKGLSQSVRGNRISVTGVLRGIFITTLASETTKVEGIEKVLGTRGQGGSLRNGVFWTQKDLCGCELTADMVT